MTVKIGKGSQCEWIPHNDVTLLTTTCDESLLAGINKGINTLLMQVKRLIVSVVQILNVVDMNETIKRRGHYVVKIWEELNLCNPSVVNVLLNDLNTVLLFVKAHGLLLKHLKDLFRLQGFF